MQQKFFGLIEEENKKGAPSSSRPTSFPKSSGCATAWPHQGRRDHQARKDEHPQEENYKSFHIEAKSPIPQGFFTLPAHKLELSGKMADFYYRGSVNAAVKKLAELELLISPS